MPDNRYIEVLRSTSRTFFIPISRLPAGLREAVGSAYLCMRAVDEIEDHQELSASDKSCLLNGISMAFQAANGNLSSATFDMILEPHRTALPVVTMDLVQWSLLAPSTIAHRIWDATAVMAARMANWVESGWEVKSVADLDRYTYAVAGSVGLLLSDLWAWHDGTLTDRDEAVGFGRGLQAVNIVRNRQEDLSRGVDFYPADWDDEDMYSYCRRNLALADRYKSSLPEGPIFDFCTIPLALAHATLDTLAEGNEKLTRSQVLKIVSEA